MEIHNDFMKAVDAVHIKYCPEKVLQSDPKFLSAKNQVMKVKSFSRASSLSYLELRTQERGLRCCRTCTTGTNPDSTDSTDFESRPFTVSHLCFSETSPSGLYFSEGKNSEEEINYHCTVV